MRENTLMSGEKCSSRAELCRSEPPRHAGRRCLPSTPTSTRTTHTDASARAARGTWLKRSLDDHVITSHCQGERSSHMSALPLPTFEPEMAHTELGAHAGWHHSMKWAQRCFNYNCGGVGWVAAVRRCSLG